MAASASLSDRTWTWDGSSHLAKSSALPFGRAVESVRARIGENFTAGDVVDEARPKNSPIHGMFEWNDKVAGERWRAEQARSYLRALIVVVPEEGGERTMPAIVSAGPGSGYVAMETALTNAVMRRAILKRALDEAQAWRRRYESMKELAGVFTALDQVPMFDVQEQAGAGSAEVRRGTARPG